MSDLHKELMIEDFSREGPRKAKKNYDFNGPLPEDFGG